MLPQRLIELLLSSTATPHHFPPTLLYNEGWLLRLVLDWFSTNAVGSHPLAFAPDAHWFSEARVPSAFLSRGRGDILAESRTNVDGVFGHCVVGSKGKADLQLSPNATQLVFTEAKMSSGLSSNVKGADYFDQAARNVACIAELLWRVRRPAQEMSTLGFFVLAPKAQITKGVFKANLQRSSISEKVEQRVRAYEGTKDQWYVEAFVPAFTHMVIETISWEQIIEDVRQIDQAGGDELAAFYNLCLKLN